jgi:DNA-directed RNA polymerase subunit RPC12/RpoP
MSQSLKYVCKECGKEVKAVDLDQIIANEKMCADCRSLEITGGKVEKKVFQPKKKVVYTGPLRREDGPKKKKKPLSAAQKESLRMAAEAKWDRERYGMKSYVNYKDEDK